MIVWVVCACEYMICMQNWMGVGSLVGMACVNVWLRFVCESPLPVCMCVSASCAVVYMCIGLLVTMCICMVGDRVIVCVG